MDYPKIMLWNDRRVEELSREELLEVVAWLAEDREYQRAIAKGDREMRHLFLTARETVSRFGRGAFSEIVVEAI
jgi:hypothetical protein